MGNNHCHSSSSRSNYGSYQYNGLDDCYSENFVLPQSQGRTSPNSRFPGGTPGYDCRAMKREAKEIRRHAREKARELRHQAKEVRHQARDQRRCQKGCIIEKVMPSFGVNNLPQNRIPHPQHHQQQVGHPYPEINRNVVQAPHREAREANSPLTICQYCDDLIMSHCFEDHLRQCGPKPKPSKKNCDFCGDTFNINEIEKHKQNCDAKVENIKVACDHCLKPVSLVDLNYHLSTCCFNPQNNRLSKNNSNQTPEEEVNECVICLLEIKKDSEVRFLKCAHNFHTACIEDWSKKKKTCPVCMTEFN